MTGRTRLLSARWILRSSGDRHAGHRHAGEWLDGGAVLVRGARIVRLARNPGEARRLARAQGVVCEDFGDAVLAPGFVDAHTHLDLSALAGRLAGRGTFASWIRSLIRERENLGTRELAAAAAAGVERLLETGTTLAGDIDATGAAEGACAARPLRVRSFLEVLDAGDPARTRVALARLRSNAARRARRARLTRGFSPHSPYTASPGLLRRVAEHARRKRLPVCIHWAETREEVAWLADGRGPLRALLSRSPGRLSRSPGRSGLDLVAEAGLLSRRLVLVHGNHPGPGDLERVARSGATLVHCPGSHAFFGREPFDLRACLSRGVPVALGTDSMASNDDLDMRREIALLRRASPWLAPAQAFDMATRAGARALGFEGRAGEIAPGAFADLCVHDPQGLSRRDWGRPERVLEELTLGKTPIRAVWIGGRPVRPT